MNMYHLYSPVIKFCLRYKTFFLEVSASKRSSHAVLNPCALPHRNVKHVQTGKFSRQSEHALSTEN